MRINTSLFLVITIMSSYGSGYECPPLKWTKNINEINIVPDVITELSDTSFLCNGNMVLDKRDGSVIESKPGFLIKHNSRTQEGGFVVTDGNRITVIDKNLEELWSKEIGSNLLRSVIQTRDSGYAALEVITELEEYQIIITDKKGDILRKFHIEGNFNYKEKLLKIEFEGLVEVDEGIVVYGNGMKATAIWIDALVSKYSFSGDEVWSKIFGGTEISDFIGVEDGVAFTGYTDPEGWEIVDTTFSQPGLGKRLYFPDTHVPIIYLNSQGEIVFNISVVGMEYNRGKSIRKNGNLFFLASYCRMHQGAIEEYQFRAFNGSGERQWHRCEQKDSYPDQNKLRIQPFSTGDLVILMMDTLYYYAKPTDTKKENFANRKQYVNNSFYKIDNENICYNIVESSEVTVSLLTLDGKVMRTFDEGLKPVGRYLIPVKNLPRGAYLVKFRTDNLLNVGKMIISR